MAGCLMRNAVAQIRYRYDGTAPTSTVGTILEIGDVKTFADVRDVAAFRAIRTGATSGILSIECWPRP